MHVVIMMHALIWLGDAFWDTPSIGDHVMHVHGDYSHVMYVCGGYILMPLCVF